MKRTNLLNFKTPARCCRYVHNSTLHNSATPLEAPPVTMTSYVSPVAKKLPPLSILSTSSVLRSYLITRATSSPILLGACFAVLKQMLRPNAVILSPERNPLLRWIFKHTFYTQFCAGENKTEVRHTLADVRKTGYSGVILEYALELLQEDGATKKTTAEEIAVFRKGMLDSIDMADPGDFVALKWSGLGEEALGLLNKGLPPTSEMESTILEVCDAAAAKDIALLPGAELEITNQGIDAWTLNLQRKYNKQKALVYTTYQAYLCSTPSRISRDLAVAQNDGFTLGVKLVRGAYLASEPKSNVWPSKAATDEAFDHIVEALLRRTYTQLIQPSSPYKAVFPDVALLIASHNAPSIAKAREIRVQQAANREPRILCTYAQLRGMADEISCGLIADARQERQAGVEVDVPRPYKCATWGTVGECLHFLYRRAAENQDAAGRTVETRRAMGLELWRRVKARVGMS
jgi:proline dehydrogenase-like protein